MVAIRRSVNCLNECCEVIMTICLVAEAVPRMKQDFMPEGNSRSDDDPLSRGNVVERSSAHDEESVR